MSNTTKEALTECLMADCTEPQAHFCVKHVLEVYTLQDDALRAENARLRAELERLLDPTIEGEQNSRP